MRYSKTITMLISCGLVLLLGPIGLAAQQASDPAQPSRPDLDQIRKVSALLDADVMNKANETIAGVEDLVLAPEGTVRYAVLSHGGVAGVGASYIAVPWDALDVKHINGKWAVNLDRTKEAIEKAPALKADNYRDLTNPEYVTRVHDYFGARAESQGRAGQESQTRGNRAVEMVLLATKINDATLRNAQNEDIGEVEDLLLDRNFRVAYAIAGRGGVLGIGESYVPVPWSKLRLNYNREDNSITAMIDATKQKLEQAPLVKGDSYSTLLAPGFAAQVDRYFGVTRSDRATPRDGDNRP